MKNKKSFILYCDLIHTVDKLPDEVAGKLFKHILSYVNDLNPKTDDIIIQVAFEPIKQALKRDLDKWNNIRSKRSEAGKISANKRKQNKQVLTSVNKSQQTSTNSTVNDNVSVNVNVNENVSNIESRKNDFKKYIFSFSNKYPNEMLLEFFEYWSEHGLKDRKMKFEKEKSFGVARRLSTWQKFSKKFNKLSNLEVDPNKFDEMKKYEI